VKLSRLRWLAPGLLMVLGTAAAAWLALRATPAAAAPPEQAGVSNEYCLECHSRPGLTRKLTYGEELYLTIDPVAYAESVHGAAQYACVQCHTTIREYPHPPLQADRLRDVTLEYYQTCQQCHSDMYALIQDSVHQSALDRGNANAAVCTDCHNPHYQGRLTDEATGDLLPSARLVIPQTCARCHSAIYDQYKQSVHGSALIGEGNPDVPTCIDCHGVHNIADPTTTEFRLTSPQMCGRCHTDETLMAKYDISTAVLDTYLADFHGTTVRLFEHASPDEPTNKPVCNDCHGIHDIAAASDPAKGLEVRENLLSSCLRCHPNATVDFPDAWLSHYVPSPDKNPLVYYVNVFYRIFIPAVIGGMVLFVATDAYRIVRRRRDRTRPPSPDTKPGGEG